MIRFQCLKGKQEGQIFEFQEDSIVFGRSSECQVTLRDISCSRRHACLKKTAEGYTFSDLHSTNGIFVNGKRRTQANLAYGDRFSVGRIQFIFLSEITQEQVQVPDKEDPHIQNTISIQDLEKKLERFKSDSDGGAATDEAWEETKLKDPDRIRNFMKTFYQISRAMNSTLNNEDLYPLIADKIYDIISNVECIRFFLAGEQTGKLTLHKCFSKDGEDTETTPVSRSVLNRVQSERVGIIAMDASTDSRFAGSDSIVIANLKSLMCIPLLVRNRVIGAIYVENCTKSSCFTDSDLEILTLLGGQAAFAIENARLYRNLQLSFYETVRSLCNALEAKDEYTRGHSDRVARYAVGIGSELGLSEERLKHLRIAAELHDIGKIAISERIIGKKGKLTDEEFQIIKKHPKLGVSILEPIGLLKPVLPMILHHHERCNGEGYPDQLKETEIPLEARILNLADAFDAMTTQRPYNAPRTIQEALDQCNSEAGISFDLACVEALNRFVNKTQTASLVTTDDLLALALE